MTSTSEAARSRARCRQPAGRYAALRVLLSTRVEDVEEGLANAVASVLVGKESR